MIWSTEFTRISIGFMSVTNVTSLCVAFMSRFLTCLSTHSNCWGVLVSSVSWRNFCILHSLFIFVILFCWFESLRCIFFLCPCGHNVAFILSLYVRSPLFPSLYILSMHGRLLYVMVHHFLKPGSVEGLSYTTFHCNALVGCTFHVVVLDCSPCFVSSLELWTIFSGLIGDDRNVERPTDKAILISL